MKVSIDVTDVSPQLMHMLLHNAGQSESEIKMSDNVVYGIGENITPSENDADIKLTNNASYVNSRLELKTTANVCYAPSQQVLQRHDYDYSQYENYDYI